MVSTIRLASRDNFSLKNGLIDNLIFGRSYVRLPTVQLVEYPDLRGHYWLVYTGSVVMCLVSMYIVVG